MTSMSSKRRYSRWDGTQDIAELDADAIMSALSDDVMNHGDLRSALRSLLRRGLDGEAPMQGLRNLLRQLREARKERLSRFDLDSVMDDINERLEEVVTLERESLERLEGRSIPNSDGARDDRAEADGPDGGLSDGETSDREHSSPANPDTGSPGQSGIDEDPASQGPAGAQGRASRDTDDDSPTPSFADSLMRTIADRNREFLDGLPDDAPGKVSQLKDYEFTSPDAQRKFEELLDSLRQAVTRSFFQDVQRMMDEMSEGDIDRIKDMVRDLNEMLVRHIGGEDPDFEGFMAKHGDLFGDDPPGSIEELVERMQSQMAAMQSLMMSMSTEQFEQLQQLLQDRFGDAELNQDLRSLSQKLDFLDPSKGRQFRFSGSEDIDLQGAMRLMDEMHDLEELERQLRAAHDSGEIDGVDADKLDDLLGPEARDALEKMNQMTEMLERAGYVDRDGERTELTPRGMRTIGRKALGEIFNAIKRHSLGNHPLPQEGRFGERLDDTKPYEFGDPFDLHLPRSLRNALVRTGLGTPVELQPEDFEVYRHEQATRTSTVLLIDLSWSMELRGAFVAAKKVALALNNLITSAFPRDDFHIVGFSAYAKQLGSHDIPFLSLDEYVLGTNMHHALLIAEKLLAGSPGGTKQVLMITDGEPTAHIERGRAQFAYPPTPRTIRETLRAVKRCTRQRITINTFMLDEGYYLRAFMDEVSRINGGRVFYASPERLGEYVLVDYVQNKRKVLGRQ